MEVLLEEGNDVLRIHAGECVLLGTTALGVVWDLLLVSREESVGQCNGAGALDPLSFLLRAVCTSSFVELNGVNEVIDFADLSQSLADDPATAAFWYVANEKADGKWVPIESISSELG